MISKRDLGIGYLLGTGIGISFSLVILFLIRRGPVLLSMFETFTALLLSLAMLYVGQWLMESDLAQNHIWAVARWSALGLAVPTIILFFISWFGLQPTADYLTPSLAINNIAGGGVTGVLLGSIHELHKEHHTTQELNQQNLVMNRVLRHNIRNDMNIILGYAQRLESEVDNPPEELVKPIQRKAMEVVDLSRSARRIEEVKEAAGEAVEVTQVVRDKVESVRETNPEVRVSSDLPQEAWVFADAMLSSVIENVVENAIEHNDRKPEIEVTVREVESWIEIVIADNGPGIPDQERDVLLDEDATQIKHGNGLGLWLVKWFVKEYGGELELEENDPRGTVIVLRLQAASKQRPTATKANAPARSRAATLLGD